MALPQAFDAFRADFKGDVVRPSDEDYQVAIHRWAVNAQKPAAAVLYVEDDKDIAAAVAFARQHKLDFAVRGGGHSSSGASSSDGGLVIDLPRYYKTVHVDADAKVAYAGGGATWDDVNYAAIKYGLATPGGKIGETGVGGLTLGGGLGFLSGAHGLVVDNMVGAKVVLATGEAVACGPVYATSGDQSGAEHDDLFWAIRGGGGNFGIVTTFAFKLHPQPENVFCGMLGWPINPNEEDAANETYRKVVLVCEAFQMRKKQGEEALWVMWAAIPLPGRTRGPVLLVLPYCHGTEAEGRERFKDILALDPVLNTTKVMPYPETAHILPTKHGFNRYQSPCNLSAPLSTIAPSIVSTLRSHLASCTLPNVQPLVMLEMFDPAPVEAVASDAMAFHRRDWGGAVSGALAYGWDTHTGMAAATGARAEQAKEVGKVEELTIARGMIREMADAIAGRKIGDGGGEVTYGNYITESADAKTSQGVFGPNYPRLQRIKAMYDPDTVWGGKWFPIQPSPAPAL